MQLKNEKYKEKTESQPEKNVTQRCSHLPRSNSIIFTYECQKDYGQFIEILKEVIDELKLYFFRNLRNIL